MHDNVNHPVHYTAGEIECIDAILSATEGLNGPEAYLTGQVMKYLWRWDKKNGLEDLQKAKWYLERLEEFGLRVTGVTRGGMVMNKTDFHIEEGPVAISLECPHCTSTIVIEWRDVDVPRAWEGDWGSVRCPYCKKDIELGNYEID